MDKLPWTIKYAAEKTKDVFGQNMQIDKIRDYIKNYKNQKKKGAIIYGPTGCGKTVAVYALGKETDSEIVELNASDLRNKNSINSVLGNALHQVSLFAKSKIILIDEVDCLSGTKDRGGLQAVAKLLEKSVFPVLLTSHNPYEQKLKGLRKKCELIEFNILNYKDIYLNLKRIGDSENIEYDDVALKGLARRSGGDMRAAINDFQLLSGSRRLKKEDLDFLSEREQKGSIESALLKIFKTSSTDIALRALDNIDEDIDKIFLWMDANLPKEYLKAKDLSRAYEKLSRADVYKGRIRKRQHWRFLVYIYALLSAGVSVSKDEKYSVAPEFKQSERPLKIWIANMKYKKRESIAEKISSNSHISSKQALKRDLPFVQNIIKNNPDMAKQIIDEFDLDEEEIKWFNK
ncbi:MAG: replication factor C large subunit [Nanobdellota archaeon]